MATFYYRPYQSGPYGADDGSSYANAWYKSADIDWTQITAGDTLYVCGLHDAGGTNSSGLNAAGWRASRNQGEPGNPIVISGNPPEEPNSGDIILAAKTLRSTDTWVDEGDGIWSHSVTVGGSASSLYNASEDWFITDTGSLLTSTTPGPAFYRNPVGEKFWYRTIDGKAPATDVYVYGWNLFNWESSTYVADGLWSPSYVRVEDLRIRNFGLHCFSLAHVEQWHILRCRMSHSLGQSAVEAKDGSNNCTMEDCEVHDMASGVYASRSNDSGYPQSINNWTVRGNHFHNLYRHTASDGDVHGIGWQGGNNNLWENNLIENIYGTGMTWFLGGRGSENNILRNNVFRNFDEQYVRPTPGLAAGLPAISGTGIELTGGNTNRTGNTEFGNIIEHNYVSNCTDRGNQAQGWGIKIKGPKDIGNGVGWTVRYNHIEDCVYGLYPYSQNVDGGSADGEAGGIIHDNTVQNCKYLIDYQSTKTIAGYTITNNKYRGTGLFRTLKDGGLQATCEAANGVWGSGKCSFTSFEDYDAYADRDTGSTYQENKVLAWRDNTSTGDQSYTYTVSAVDVNGFETAVSTGVTASTTAGILELESGGNLELESSSDTMDLEVAV